MVIINGSSMTENGKNNVFVQRNFLATGHKENYLKILNRRNLFTWFWAVAVAFLINIALFMIMTILQNPDSAITDTVEVFREEAWISRKPQEVVRKKEKIIPEQQKKDMAPPPRKTLSIKSMPVTLPFKVNTKLKVTAEMVKVPPVASGIMHSLTLPDVFFADDLDVPISMMARIPPVYPLRARQRRIEGWVKVKLLVNERGEVDQVDILEAEPTGIFESNVKSCVKKWKFSKAMVAGIPVKVWMVTTVRFQLEN